MRNFLINVNLFIFLVAGIAIAFLSYDDLKMQKERFAVVNEYLIKQSMTSNASETKFPSERQKKELEMLEVSHVKRTVKDGTFSYSYELYVPSVMNNLTKHSMMSSTFIVETLNY